MTYTEVEKEIAMREAKILALYDEKERIAEEISENEDKLENLRNLRFEEGQKIAKQQCEIITKALRTLGEINYYDISINHGNRGYCYLNDDYEIVIPIDILENKKRGLISFAVYE